MHRLNHPTHAPMPRRQRGISLIESLVAVVVMAAMGFGAAFGAVLVALGFNRRHQIIPSR